MRRFLLCIALLLCLPSVRAAAQAATDPEEPPAEEPPAEEPPAEEPPAEEPDEAPGQPPESPRLRAPSVEPPDVGLPPEEGAPEDEEEEAEDEAEEEEAEGEEREPAEAEPEESAPGMSEDLLQQAEPEEAGQPPSSDPTMSDWTAPESVLTLHGYFRVRGEMWDNFMLSQSLAAAEGQPFAHFAPVDNDSQCGVDPDASPCGDRLRFANMRMRLQPTLSLSDDVRVHMMVDVFDNLVLGSTPESEAWVPGSDGGFDRTNRVPGDGPLDSFSETQLPQQGLRNDLEDGIKVRRAWAEVTNRGIGQLRFGRMGSHWGLGIFQNAGEGIDSDFSTDVDRIMGITKVAGFHFIAAWDWANEGYLIKDAGDLRNFDFDGTNRDDMRQWTLAVARRVDAEEQRARLERGDWVLNGGLYFVMRKQSTTSDPIEDPFDRENAAGEFERRDMRAFIPDLWGQFLWKGLRLEAEAVMVAGKIGNIENEEDPDPDDDHRLLQLGLAFEGEYRLLDDQLGIYLYGGFASGDPQAEGLSYRENVYGGAGNDRITTYTFHPDYRIDLILWRNVMQRVAGAWYLRPGVSYDIVRNSFGQLLGGRLDVVYSRAATRGQTYGGDKDLGLELDMSLYYRSEDGPEITDGFYAMAQFGILFPFDGLGSVDSLGDRIDPGRAWVFRTVLGVQF
ncbi:MAG: TIGR04551 family protein [Myxococcota bacterium]